MLNNFSADTKKLLKGTGFCLLSLFVFLQVQLLFRPDDDRAYSSQIGFYRQPKNSLQAVYIGSSTTYHFFQPALAYANHGIRVFTLTSPSMPSIAQKFWLEEAYKRHPDALFILNLTAYGFEQRLDEQSVHSALDFMRPGLTKLRMIRMFLSLTELQISELLFPMIRFHDKWEILAEEILQSEFPELMGSATNEHFMRSSNPMLSCDFSSEEVQPIHPKMYASLEETFDVIERLQAKVIFVAVPQTDELRQAEMKHLEAYVRDAGYDVYNMYRDANDIALNPSEDFYDWQHTNLHGSIKVTHRLCRYLKEHYPEIFISWESPEWENAKHKYIDIIASEALDFEILGRPQTLDLSAPQGLIAAYDEVEKAIKLTWDPVHDATGYSIHRKISSGLWEFAGKTEKPLETIFFDKNAPVNHLTDYTYTVVPFTTDGEGKQIYGRWSRRGVSVSVRFFAPKLLSLESAPEGSATLRWDAIPEAKQYTVYRKDAGGDWKIIGRTEGTEWTDIEVRSGETYAFTVCGTNDHLENGYRDEDGLTITMP